MPSIYQDNQARIAIVSEASANFITYIQHSGKKVDLYRVPTKDFNKFFKIVEGGKTGPVDAAKKLLALAVNGVGITPEAKQELQGIVAKAPLMEAPMAIPTTLSKNNGKAATAPKKSAPQKLSEMPVAENPDDKISKPAADTAPVVETPKKARAPRAEKVAVEISDLVKQAQADADAMIAEATAALEDAKQKAEEKREAAAARAEAQKIIDKAKVEVAKIKAQIKKLSTKRGRKANGNDDGESGTERAPRDTEDISDKKIVQVSEPVVREGSARGELILAVYKCKTVKKALEYEGVRPQMIKQMVTKGYISLAD
jgi:hypothetical protein